jgi:hypothetical protein
MRSLGSVVQPLTAVVALLLVGTAACDTIKEPPALAPGATAGRFDGRWRGVGAPETIGYGDGTFCTEIKLDLTVSGGKVEGRGTQMRFGNRTIFMKLSVEGDVSDAGVFDGTLAWVYAPVTASVALNGRIEGARLVASYTGRQCRYDFVIKRV